MIVFKYVKIQREGTVPDSKGVSVYVEKLNTAIWEHCIATDHSNVCVSTKTSSMFSDTVLSVPQTKDDHGWPDV